MLNDTGDNSVAARSESAWQDAVVFKIKFMLE
jgi:hypothetical protein